jgi:CRISPR/Cas system-associated endonuclease Cas1
MPSQPKRIPLWLPYIQSVEKIRGGHYLFKYNGGSVEAGINEMLSIMLYGDTGDFPLSVLEEIALSGVPIVIHKRTVSKSCWIHAGNRPDVEDVIARQLAARDNLKKRQHIARKILEAKFQGMSWLIAPPYPGIPPGASIDQMRIIEAHFSRRYWDEYYAQLNVPQYSRRGNNTISQTLDAVSKFCCGPILRWATYHHLSPYHGFLHEPTTYPSLIYDLFEPYRGMFDRAVFHALKAHGCIGKPQLNIQVAINAVKEAFTEEVYTPATRQIISRQELLHGITLSLRNYLLRKSPHFIVPMPGIPNGGRPRKVGFRFYGRSAGKTDFWEVARTLPIT